MTKAADIIKGSPRLREVGQITLPSLTVIIPSRSVENLLPCVEAVRHNEPKARIIVVDDGVDFNQWECFGLVGDDLAARGISVMPGVKPFVFARNCNLGIKRANQDDVILLNDDAILETRGGFTAMQEFVAQRLDVGLVSSSTNVAGNVEQHRRGLAGARLLLRATPGNSFPTVAFVCVLIPRRTLDAVGLLDERFTAYGWEDNDYCRRLAVLGQRIAVHDGCFVDHSKLTSTFRAGAYAAGDINKGRQIYMEKWGSV